MAAINLLSLIYPGAITIHDTQTVSQDALVVISNSRSKVVAHLPASISLSIKNKWSSALGELSDSTLLSAADSVGQIVTGTSFAGNPLFSRVTYKGTDPLTLTLELQFVDFINPRVNVKEKVDTLIDMASPKLIGNAVSIPGPVAFPEATEGVQQAANAVGIDRDNNSLVNNSRPITVRLGRQLELTSCYIMDLSVTYNSYLSDGVSTSAKVSITLGSNDTLAITSDFGTSAAQLQERVSIQTVGLERFRSQVLP